MIRVSVAPIDLPEAAEQELVQPDSAWACVVWDDPVNLMSYVTHVFMSYFKYSQEKATELMLEVHNSGKAAVASGSREEVERHVNAMHGYGLWATVEKAE